MIKGLSIILACVLAGGVGGASPPVDPPAVEAEAPEMEYLGAMEITAYNVYEGGGENLSTASGMEPVAWHTCAAPSWIPFGTVLYVDGIGELVVADRGGGSVEGGRIDVFVGTDPCESIGLAVRDVYIVRQP